MQLKFNHKDQLQNRNAKSAQMSDKSNRVLYDNRSKQIVQNKQKENTVIQRMIVTPEKDYKVKMGKNNKAATNKLELLIELMQEALQHVPPIDGTIQVEVINQGEMTPAWNHHKGSKWHPGKKGDIGVELNRWYLEKASVGELVGMFNHEIGVHTVADKFMGLLDHGTEAMAKSEYLTEIEDQKKDHRNPLGGRIEKYPNYSESNPRFWRRTRQRDHVNLAKSLSNGFNARGKHYLGVYLRTGDAIDKKMGGKQKDKALKDLTQYFIFDIARLVATDDGGALSIIWNAKNISILMNFYRQEILSKHEKTFGWLKTAAQGISTGKWQIGIWLLKQLGTLSISSNPAVQTGRSVLGGLGTAYLVGGSIAGMLSLPAVGAGLIAGGLLYGAQKYFGV
jgi:hypothetical protein